MKFGVCLTHYGREVGSAELVEAVEEIERLGFDSIWVTDHVVIPEGVREAQLIYREHMLEAFTVFSYLAAVSQRALLGSSIIVLAYRNPVVMAKMLASIDVFSGGRVIFGAAAGYMEGEFDALGVRFEERGDVSDEYLRDHPRDMDPRPDELQRQVLQLRQRVHTRRGRCSNRVRPSGSAGAASAPCGGRWSWATGGIPSGSPRRR